MRFSLVSELYSSWEIIFNKLILPSRPKQSSKQSLVGQLVKNPAVGDLGSIPGLGRSPGEGKGYPLQYSGLENSGSQTVGHDWVTVTFFHFGELKEESKSIPMAEKGRAQFGNVFSLTNSGSWLAFCHLGPEEYLCIWSHQPPPSSANILDTYPKWFSRSLGSEQAVTPHCYRLNVCLYLPTQFICWNPNPSMW